jgi:hypothetical protein
MYENSIIKSTKNYERSVKGWRITKSNRGGEFDQSTTYIHQNTTKQE